MDICLGASMMSSCVAMLREGHLEMLYRVFTRLKKYHNTEMIFGISVSKIKGKYFECKDYSSSEFGNVLKKRVQR